jgi:hypothetical protein
MLPMIIDGVKWEIEICDHPWNLPKEGRENVFYIESGYMGSSSTTYVWRELQGKFMYMPVIFRGGKCQCNH